ncbi:hypothetical protein RFI_37162 [Reticulomyxa filosa]|uniref:Uncharacterized protein n=1 Tax=Reticulomyxa filosa TaxID=46433 RepID=X6LHU1_RETFI|nr:hypothetical protein RFI_37162 [Reticulomyxa filosa]|eukprot:ETO00285.1 hypothetical protein RFI_37162 [Reticulomyxa filosa]
MQNKNEMKKTLKNEKKIKEKKDNVKKDRKKIKKKCKKYVKKRDIVPGNLEEVRMATSTNIIKLDVEVATSWIQQA